MVMEIWSGNYSGGGGKGVLKIMKLAPALPCGLMALAAIERSMMIKYLFPFLSFRRNQDAQKTVTGRNMALHDLQNQSNAEMIGELIPRTRANENLSTGPVPHAPFLIDPIQSCYPTIVLVAVTALA